MVDGWQMTDDGWQMTDDRGNEPIGEISKFPNFQILLYFLKINVFPHFGWTRFWVSRLFLACGVGLGAISPFGRGVAVHVPELLAHLTGSPVQGQQETSDETVKEVEKDKENENIHKQQN